MCSAWLAFWVGTAFGALMMLMLLVVTKGE